MTAPDLSAIRAQLAGITPGPWEFVGPDIEQCGETWGTVIENSVDCGSYCYGGSVRQEVKPEDAAFIAAAPSTVTRLLGIVERVEKVRQELLELSNDDNWNSLHRAAYRDASRAIHTAITGEGA